MRRELEGYEEERSREERILGGILRKLYITRGVKFGNLSSMQYNCVICGLISGLRALDGVFMGVTFDVCRECIHS